MACCLLFFDDSPVEGDPRLANVNTWQVRMIDAPLADPLCCLSGCCCPWCTQYALRKKALHNDMTQYRCCQGYFDMACLKAGSCGEQSCPTLCLCVEVCCCNCFAVNATRLLIMDERDLISDPCDNRFIRFNNCLQILTCIFSLLAICIEELREAASCLNAIAQCVYWTMVGCMSAQMNVEMKAAKEDGAYQVQVATEVDPKMGGYEDMSRV